MSNKLLERNTTLANQLNEFKKSQTQQLEKGSFTQTRGRN